MATQPQHRGLKDALNEGIKSLRKWYGRVDSTSAAYFICLGMFLLPVILRLQTNFSILVLDPNIKDMYFRSRWDSEQYDAGMKELEEVVSNCDTIDWRTGAQPSLGILTDDR
jgi:hypothetical protein